MLCHLIVSNKISSILYPQPPFLGVSALFLLREVLTKKLFTPFNKPSKLMEIEISSNKHIKNKKISVFN